MPCQALPLGGYLVSQTCLTLSCCTFYEGISTPLCPTPKTKTVSLTIFQALSNFTSNAGLATADRSPTVAVTASNKPFSRKVSFVLLVNSKTFDKMERNEAMLARQKKGGADRGRSASTVQSWGKDGSKDVREQNCKSSNQVSELYFSAFVHLHWLIEEADFDSSISNKLVCFMETDCSLLSYSRSLSTKRRIKETGNCPFSFYQKENKGDWELSILFY